MLVLIYLLTGGGEGREAQLLTSIEKHSTTLRGTVKSCKSKARFLEVLLGLILLMRKGEQETRVAGLASQTRVLYFQLLF